MKRPAMQWLDINRKLKIFSNDLKELLKKKYGFLSP